MLGNEEFPLSHHLEVYTCLHRLSDFTEMDSNIAYGVVVFALKKITRTLKEHCLNVNPVYERRECWGELTDGF
jgi:hypothetical protein